MLDGVSFCVGSMASGLKQQVEPESEECSFEVSPLKVTNSNIPIPQPSFSFEKSKLLQDKRQNIIKEAERLLSSFLDSDSNIKRPEFMTGSKDKPLQMSQS
jgi:hypothetical protein